MLVENVKRRRHIASSVVRSCGACAPECQPASASQAALTPGGRGGWKEVGLGTSLPVSSRGLGPTYSHSEGRLQAEGDALGYLDVVLSPPASTWGYLPGLQLMKSSGSSSWGLGNPGAVCPGVLWV